MKLGLAAFVLFLLLYSINVAKEAPGKELFGNPNSVEIRLEYAFRELRGSD
jgi:hypothetical protein